jgi:type IV pilus assembly protein PilX
MRAALIRPRAQAGVSLAVALLMLVVILLLAMSGAKIAVHSEKAARNDRDRQIALHAAEAALLDAEADIQGSSAAPMSRSLIFAPGRREGFPDDGCARGRHNRYLGLCATAEAGAVPIWLTVDFLTDTEDAGTVPYGQFTEHVFPAGEGALPAHPPRYVIELLPERRSGKPAQRTSSTYRITAIGFGMRASTQVVLQSDYRKTAAGSPPTASGRIGWREIINWNELRNESSRD